MKLNFNIDFNWDTFKKIWENLYEYWSFLDDDEYGDYDKKDEKFLEYVRILEDYMIECITILTSEYYHQSQHKVLWCFREEIKELSDNVMTCLRGLYSGDKKNFDVYKIAKQKEKEKENEKTRHARRKVEKVAINDENNYIKKK